jgi:hypothetical protein
MSGVGRAARGRAAGRAGRARAVLAVAAAAAAVLAAAGCSGGSSPGAGGQASGGGSPGSCPGAPIKLVTFWSLSGDLGVFGNDVPNAAAAAVKAVNADCAAGRPLQVTVCDDQSTSNGSIQCGTEARKDGDLAIIGATAGPGGSDEGAQTADLPALFTADQTSWDNSSPLSYPDDYPLLAMAGQVRTAQALGKKSFDLAAVDIPDAHVQAEIGASEAKAAGLDFIQTYFPLDTTDFSSVAAQIVSAGPGALDFLLPQPEQFITALTSVGANFKQMTLIADQGILTPQQEKALAATLQGQYEVGSDVPAAATSNAGIRQMEAEYKAAGLAFSPDLSAWAVQEWSAIHALAEALKPLSRSQLGSLTSATLARAVVAHGQYSLPAVAPFDFQKNPFPKTSLLGQGRTYSSSVGVFTFNNGTPTPVGTFQDVNGTFNLKN